jgi:hypothetical protein
MLDPRLAVGSIADNGSLSLEKAVALSIIEFAIFDALFALAVS